MYLNIFASVPSGESTTPAGSISCSMVYPSRDSDSMVNMSPIGRHPCRRAQALRTVNPRNGASVVPSTPGMAQALHRQPSELRKCYTVNPPGMAQ
eukprot:8529448-Pyramimonas_sp.AAC.1